MLSDEEITKAVKNLELGQTLVFGHDKSWSITYEEIYCCDPVFMEWANRKLYDVTYHHGDTKETREVYQGEDVKTATCLLLEGKPPKVMFDAERFKLLNTVFNSEGNFKQQGFDPLQGMSCELGSIGEYHALIFTPEGDLTDEITEVIYGISLSRFNMCSDIAMCYHANEFTYSRRDLRVYEYWR